ncbi:hypothetical protein GO103_004399 [Salmonella enterica]|nr:hypothetical protein [Salmonella enterica]
MSEEELSNAISALSDDWGVEPGEDGDIGFYAYVDGGYLPNLYSSVSEALTAIFGVVQA